MSKSAYIIITLTLLLLHVSGCEEDEVYWERMPKFKDQSINIVRISSDNSIFAGTDIGLFYSTDHGIHWTGTDLVDWISVLAQGDSGYFFAANGGGRCYRSIDTGRSWTQAKAFSSAVEAIVINKSGVVFAGTNGGGVYRSSDHGYTWTEVNSGLTGGNILTMGINKQDHLFAGINGHGLFRSIDGGDTWVHIQNGFTSLYPTCMVTDKQNAIYVGSYDGAYGTVGGVFLSTNSGTDWQITGLNKVSIQCITIESYANVYACTWAYESDNDDAIRFSIDHGKKWYNLKSDGLETRVNSIAIDLEGYIYGGTDKGLFRAKL